MASVARRFSQEEQELEPSMAQLKDEPFDAQDAEENDSDVERAAGNRPEPFPIEEGNPTPNEPQTTRSKFRVAAILAALFLSLFVAALNQTIVATAIPTIASELNSASGYTWIGGAYLLANAAAAPIWAKLSDIWGRKPILLAAVALFFFSCIICAKTVSIEMLIVGRAFQGIAGAGLMQMVTITISDLFSMRSRSLYLGMLEFVWCLAGGVGPILGGVFTQYISWRWSWWINLPVSGATFIILFFFLDVHNPKTKALDGLKAIDWWGSLSILGFTLMLLLGLDFGGVIFPWSSPKVICLIIIGTFMGFLFFLSEKKFARYPLVPLKLFHHKSNIACLVLGFMHFAVFIAGEFYLPLYFQAVHEASPSTSGLLVLPVTVGEALMGIATGIIIHRTGRYQEVIWIGVLLMTIGTGLYIHLGANSNLGEIIGFQVVAGFGCGFLFEPPIIAIQALAGQDDVATATATLGFVRNLATAVSVVIGGVIFQNGMQNHASRLRAAGLPDSLVQKFSGQDAAASVLLVSTIPDSAQRYAVKQAFAESLRNIWILYTCMAACGLVASVFVVRAKLSKEHTETRTGIREKTDDAT